MAKQNKPREMPFAQQEEFPSPWEDLGKTTAVPRSTEYDLSPTYSRTRMGTWGDEQTFTVNKPGNKVREDGRL